MVGFLFSLLTLVATPGACEFTKAQPGEFELSYQKKIVKVPVDAADAKLVLCKPWKGFPNLLVVEVNMGTVSTRGEAQRTQLQVFDTSKATVKKLLEKEIEQTHRQKDPKTGEVESSSWKNPYTLKKTKSGKPSVFFAKSKETKVLQ